jgi:uncharacterized SAM-binding protein YcdF (DUF218 family)
MEPYLPHPTRVAGTPRRRWVAAAVLLCLVIASSTLVLARGLWLPAIGHFLIVSDELVRADAVVALAGEEARQFAAASVYQAGVATVVLVTELPLGSEADRRSYVERARHRLIQHGVPPASIHVVPGVGTTTYAEVVNVRAFVEQRGLTSLVIVTSPWHTRRARMVASRAFAGSDVDVRVRPSEGSDHEASERVYHPDAWWSDEYGRVITTSEWLKILGFMVGIR